MSKATINLIKVKDIQNGVYVMEDDSLVGVLKFPGVNFSLASAKEQELLVSTFKQFLDGLDFSVQILIISRYLNIDRYLNILQEKLKQTTEPLINFQLEEYINFLKEYVATHHIMQKNFYVIVPYQTLEAQVGFKFPFSKKTSKQASEDFSQKLSQLRIRISYVLESLSAFGVEPKVLDDRELLILLFDLLNPSIYWQTVPEEVFDALSKIS